MTPLGNLNLIPQTLQVPAQFQGSIANNLTVWLPDGFTASVFHIGGLSKLRFMVFSPDGILHVASKNGRSIIALPDADNDGIADMSYIAADNFVKPHDLKFYKGSMYVADEQIVWKLSDTDNDGVFEQREIFIDNIAGNAPVPTGGHDTRSIVFDDERKKFYLSIGSRSNVAREEYRAVIEEYNDDGTGGRIYATGIRNAVGLTLRTSTGRLWATNNGSDWQGDNIPPEWIDIIRENGFYGHPFAHSNQVYFDFFARSEYQALLPITSADSALVRKQLQPAALVQAHSAPMALQFADSSFPEAFRNGAFAAFRGSWNRSTATGYKVVYLDFDSPTDTTANYVADFFTGFLTDAASGSYWGRPVGLAADTRGNLYVGSDAVTHFITLISPAVATDVDVDQKDLPAPLTFSLRQNYPNPFNPETVIRFALPVSGHVKIDVFDLTGKKVALLIDNPVPAGEHSVRFNGDNFASGIYFYRIRAAGFTGTKKMLLVK
ncbi:T9SS type A sorting domain-containing protein [candidate division KSB1 bacterium]|nr:T9SS type A sorting domain-containing protein [candidate division KSB1 bacterium]